MDNIEHNKITVSYKDGVRFGRDYLNIDIQNTSSGALRLFQKELHDLSKKERKISDDCWHPVSEAYADLLERLYYELKNKIEYGKQV